MSAAQPLDRVLGLSFAPSVSAHVLKRIPVFERGYATTKIYLRRDKEAASVTASFRRFVASRYGLERLDVLSLPTLRTLDDVELHRLTLLEAFETARRDR